ncbi:MAG: DsbA family protein [Hyphomonas sp.]|nr:thioredoxin domain-containing protein [Hyphomonas sp.]MCA8904128.1 thioredoxin domain-containing protein [Hyphomonas sp.]MCB9962731.1 thioredoxin domain-containing protein [Hyphomonas sp.]MCB9969969.1 thioredoxin domain-containing protein [Hyphomonas sp.]
MIRPLFATAALALVALTPACADSAQSGNMSRAEIEKIVHEYIVEHPEVIEEAIYALSARDKAAQEAAVKDAIKAHADELYNSPADYSIGPADAPVTVVEFFDYRCGYCKRSVDYVQGLPAAYDNKVRVVFKEHPIFGGISHDAALAALAAGRQGKYRDMHVAMMKLKSNDDLTQDKIDSIAEGLGINVQKMRADMKSMDVQKQLSDALALGDDLHVDGTPGFFVGDTAIEGANQPALDEAIKKALAG